MDIWQEALAAQDYVIRCRRWFHENAELSDLEDDTVAYILQELKTMGVACDDVPKGGVMAYIESGKPGKTVLLRADIDALPIQEDPWNMKQPKVCVSKRDGAAHMCGHDCHPAMLLGAAKILQEHRGEFAGRVVLYFERGEEHGHGDYHMMKFIQDHNIHIDGCWAQHNRPQTPVGQIGISAGGIYAGATAWGATIRGEKALACCVAIINGLNAARMRAVTPFEAVTLTSTKLRYGLEDMEPDICQISGTCRFYDADKAGRPMKEAIRRVIERTCAAYGCQIVKIFRSGPTRGVINDPVCTQLAIEAVSSVIGQNAVVSNEPSMGGESFSVLSAYYPSVMATVGVGNEEKGMCAAGHNPKYEPDEDGLKYGVAATVAYATAFLAYDQTIPFAPFEGDIDAYMASIRN